MKRLLASSAVAAALVLGGCWTAESDIDIVGDAELRNQVVGNGMYCLVDDREDAIVLRDSCLRVTWDADEERHRIENHGLFGTEIPWAEIAALAPPYHAIQLRDPDTSAGPNEPEYIVATAVIQHNSIVVLPRPSDEAYATLVAQYDGLDAVPGDYGGSEIRAGEPAVIREFLAAAAAKWAEENDAQPDPFSFPGGDEEDRALLLLRVDGVHTHEQAKDELTFAELGFQMDVYGGRDY